MNPINQLTLFPSTNVPPRPLAGARNLDPREVRKRADRDVLILLALT